MPRGQGSRIDVRAVLTCAALACRVRPGRKNQSIWIRRLRHINRW